MKTTTPFFLTVLLLWLLLPGCNQSGATQQNQAEADEPTLVHLEMSTLYTQQAAEYRALCYQAFNMAKIQLVQASRSMAMQKQAVIVDIDETMLDNSPYQAKCILENFSYPEGWSDWMQVSDARAVPGALEFVTFAKEKNVEVFYITNRKEKYREQTLNNLQAVGFPYADDAHLFMRTETNSKEERRKRVTDKYAVVMLIGDNLNDFSSDFENKSVLERFSITDGYRENFGVQFIVLPNAMYGDWESALYQYDYTGTAADRSSIRKSHLESF